MKEGKTSTGFKYSVNEKLIKDYRFVKLLAELDAIEDKEDSRAFLLCSELITKLLGDDGEERVLKHVEKDGIALPEDVYRELGEILRALEEDQEIKN